MNLLLVFLALLCSPVPGVDGISGRLTGFSVDYFEQDAVNVNSNCLCCLGCNKYLLAANTADAVHLLEVHIVADCESDCSSSGDDDNTAAAAAAAVDSEWDPAVAQAQRRDDVCNSAAAVTMTTAPAADSLLDHAIMTLQYTSDTAAAVWPASVIEPEALITAESDAPGYSAVLFKQRCLDIEALISAVLADEQRRGGSAQDVQHGTPFTLVDYNVRVLTAGISGATDSRRTGMLCATNIITCCFERCRRGWLVVTAFSA
jgi:hypothetical protein